MLRSVRGTSAGARPGRRARPAWIVVASVVAIVVTFGAGPQRVAAAGASFWDRVAEPSRTHDERVLAEAESLLGAEPRAPANLARAEALVQQVLGPTPDDFHALMLLAEIGVRTSRSAVALAALERACPRAPRGAGATACWFHLGVERSRQGRLAEARVAYERLIALGDADAAAYTNAAELLMAEGRLGEAEERYREAILLEPPPSAVGLIETSHALTLATYGLAVVLDRASQPEAAREMMARALRLDPRHAMLTAAEQPDADVFFVPDGDVYYYLGLASEVSGDAVEGAAAFEEFVRRLPRAPSAERARAHVAGLVALARTGGAARAGRAAALHVVAAGTVRADGPIPAPLVDAAWRARSDLLDACLADAVSAGGLRPREGFRLALELTIDARGVVTEAAVKSPPSLDVTFARCAEAAVRAGLRVQRPRRAHETRARLELLVALFNPAAGGV